ARFAASNGSLEWTRIIADSDQATQAQYATGLALAQLPQLTPCRRFFRRVRPSPRLAALVVVEERCEHWTAARQTTCVVTTNPVVEARGDVRSRWRRSRHVPPPHDGPKERQDPYVLASGPLRASREQGRAAGHSASRRARRRRSCSRRGSRATHYWACTTR